MTATGKFALFARWSGDRWMVVLPYAWLLLFFMLPFLIVLKLSFSHPDLAQPPYQALIQTDSHGELQNNATVQQYTMVFNDGWYWQSYLNSLRIAAVSTVLCLVLAYPMAYALTRITRRWRSFVLGLILLPFWTSFLIRIYAWIGILKPEGLLNQFLLFCGFIEQPLTLLHSESAVYIGIVYAYLPFMLLPLFTNLEKLDQGLLQAAADLGCKPWQAFWRVTLPLSLPGVAAGCFLVFVPAVGEFVIPDLLGGAGVNMIGKALWLEFFNNRDWPLASALAVVLLMVLLLPILLFQRFSRREQET